LECTFFVPLRRDANLSDGQLHSSHAWDWLDGELYRRFAGATTSPELYQGCYRDPDTGERVDDESYRFIVAVAESRVEVFHELLAVACQHFRQKCIYLSVAGRVEFVEAQDHESK
jgi:hypothetical protein